MEHAKIFTVRGRQVLAYLDHDEDQDNLLVMRLRLWSEKIGGPVQAALTVNTSEQLNEKFVELWEQGVRESFETLTADKVNEVLEKMGVWDALARVERENAEER